MYLNHFLQLDLWRFYIIIIHFLLAYSPLAIIQTKTTGWRTLFIICISNVYRPLNGNLWTSTYRKEKNTCVSYLILGIWWTGGDMNLSSKTAYLIRRSRTPKEDQCQSTQVISTITSTSTRISLDREELYVTRREMRCCHVQAEWDLYLKTLMWSCLWARGLWLPVTMWPRVSGMCYYRLHWTLPSFDKVTYISK